MSARATTQKAKTPEFSPMEFVIRNATPFKMLLMLIRDVVKKANNSVLKAKLGMDRQNTFTQAALNKIEHHTRVEAGKFSVRYCAVSNIFSAPNFSI